MKNKHLEELLYRAEMVKQDVRDEFSNLTAFQLNWKPNAETWSIGQCLDHIMVADRTYFPPVEAILEGNYSRPFWSLIPGKSKVWGKLLISMLKDTNRKLPTVEVFFPTESKVGEAIVDQFMLHEDLVIQYLQRMDTVDNGKYYVKSPVSNYITYSVRDLAEIMLLHQERHFKQAKRLMSLEKFPKADKLSRSDEEE